MGSIRRDSRPIIVRITMRRRTTGISSIVPSSVGMGIRDIKVVRNAICNSKGSKPRGAVSNSLGARCKSNADTGQRPVVFRCALRRKARGISCIVLRREGTKVAMRGRLAGKRVTCGSTTMAR